MRQGKYKVGHKRFKLDESKGSSSLGCLWMNLFLFGSAYWGEHHFYYCSCFGCNLLLCLWYGDEFSSSSCWGEMCYYFKQFCLLEENHGLHEALDPETIIS